MNCTFAVFLILSAGLFVTGCGSSSGSNTNKDVAPVTKNPSSDTPPQNEKIPDQVVQIIDGTWGAQSVVKCSDGSTPNERHYSSIVMTIKNGNMSFVEELYNSPGCKRIVSIPFEIQGKSFSDENRITGLDVLLKEGFDTYSASCNSPGKSIVDRSYVHINIISDTTLSVDEAPDNFSSCFGLKLNRTYNRLK